MTSTYESLALGLRQCMACLFRDLNIEPIVPAPVAVPIVVMFIGENPSWAGNQNVPLSSNTISGRALDKHYLKPLGMTRQQVWITDLFKCRYPKIVYHAKTKHDRIIQAVVETCTRLWLLPEVALAKPRVVVTLSDKEVYQRLRRVFGLLTPKDFSTAVGKPHQIILGTWPTVLFPLVHPDISRPIVDGDNRKRASREKWAIRNTLEYIPALKRVLANEGAA